MGISIQELKLKEVRKIIPIKINGEDLEIKIFNLMGEKRGQIIEDIRKKNEEGVNDFAMMEDIYRQILSECTDLEIEGDILNILNSPSAEMLAVQSEINEIMFELQCEDMISKISELNQLKIMLYAQLAITKTDQMNDLVEELEEMKNIDID